MPHIKIKPEQVKLLMQAQRLQDRQSSLMEELRGVSSQVQAIRQQLGIPPTVKRWKVTDEGTIHWDEEAPSGIPRPTPPSSDRSTEGPNGTEKPSSPTTRPSSKTPRQPTPKRGKTGRSGGKGSKKKSAGRGT